MRKLLTDIQVVMAQWESRRIGDLTAVQRIERLILENQRAEWQQEHPNGR